MNGDGSGWFRPDLRAEVPGLRIYERYESDGTLRLTLEGDLDLATRGALHERIRRLAFALVAERIILDLSAISFIDCAGLRAIVEALQTYERGRGPVSLNIGSEFSAAIRRLLELVEATGRAEALLRLIRLNEPGSARRPAALDHDPSHARRSSQQERR